MLLQPFSHFYFCNHNNYLNTTCFLQLLLSSVWHKLHELCWAQLSLQTQCSGHSQISIWCALSRFRFRRRVNFRERSRQSRSAPCGLPSVWATYTLLMSHTMAVWLIYASKLALKSMTYTLFYGWIWCFF